MININESKREIQFIPDKTDKEHPPERSFPLLSGYVCPFCRKVLVAYFQGRMLSEQDVEYYKKESRYVIGSVPGGHYLKLENHEDYSYYGSSERCSWEAFFKRGIVENLRLFVERHELSRMLIQPLSERIGSIPGFCVVEDVCGRDREVLLFSEDELFGDLQEKEGFDAYWKAKEKMGEYFQRLLRNLIAEGGSVRR